MAETKSGSGGGSGGPGPSFILGISTFATVLGLVALALAGIGWTIQLWSVPPASYEEGAWRAADIFIRSLKVFVSDIYYDPSITQQARVFLEPARDVGVITTILVGVRLSASFVDWFFRLRSSGHDVIVGTGPAAIAYAEEHNGMFRGRAIHLADERKRSRKRLAVFERHELLKSQVRQAAATRARRIVVDEGNDAATWETARDLAAACPKAEILAHIASPWVRDRLSRDVNPRLAAFSYADGAARQIMLAHPPYLLARNLGSASALHILIVGFGQVGQSIVREFLVTSLIPGASLMVTVVDPNFSDLEKDFHSRYPDLYRRDLSAEEAADKAEVELNQQRVHFRFVAGDFRLSEEKLFTAIKEASAAAPICAAYVAIDEKHNPFDLAHAIHAIAARRQLFRAPIFVCAQYGAGQPNLRHGAGHVGEAKTPLEQDDVRKRAEADHSLHDLRVVAFGAWRAAFDGAGLLEPEFDGQARRYHNAYEKQAALEAAAAQSHKKWETLTDQFRISNRRAAAHIRAKAFAAGFDLNTWLDEAAGGLCSHELPAAAAARMPTTDTPEMFTLGELEHRRWMLDRWLDGWRKGERDDYARLRPDFVPFSALNDKTKTKDFTVVRVTKLLLEAAKKSSRRRR